MTKRLQKRKSTGIIVGYEAGGRPIVPIARLTRRQFAVACCFCGEEHWHGRGGLDGHDYGSRLSHCLEDSHEYSADEPSPEQLESAGKLPAGRP